MNNNILGYSFCELKLKHEVLTVISVITPVSLTHNVILEAIKPTNIYQFS